MGADQLQPAAPLLYSQRGFLYCELLFAPAEREAWRRMSQESRDKSQETEDAALPALDSCLSTLDLVTDRATQTLKWAEPREFLLDIALDHFTLSRAALYESLLSGSAIFPSVSPLVPPI